MRIGEFGLKHLGLALLLGCFGGCDDGGGSDGAGGAGGAADDGGGAGGDAADTGPALDMAVQPDATLCACPGSQICDDQGACVEDEEAGCIEYDDCLDTRICVEGACEPAECESDAACVASAPAITCEQGRCVECTTDDACFMGRTCGADGRCQDPAECVDSRECDGVCSAATDTCSPRFDCRADDACADGFVCGSGGECRVENPTGSSCQGGGACGLSDVCVVSGQPDYCGACVEDRDCPGDQVCAAQADGNLCVEPAACGQDDDCLLGRVCADGSCTAPACEDDDFQGNDTFETAIEIPAGKVTGDLVSCSPDWFQLQMPAGVVAIVSLRQRDIAANLELAIFNRDGVEIGRSATGGLIESVVVGPFGSERPAYILVEQTGSWSVGRYDLEVDVLDDAASCIDDGAEQGPGDDGFDTARVVRQPGQEGFDSIAGRICPEDADYVCFRLNARERFSAHIEVLTGSPIIVGQLFKFDEEGDPLAEGNWARAGGEDIAGFNAANGTYCLKLTTTAGSGAYVASFKSVARNVIDFCDSADGIRLDDGFGRAEGRISSRDDDVLSPSCAAPRADGAEIGYTIEVAEPSLLIARLRGLNSGTLGGPVISVRSDCTDANTELGCATGSTDPDEPLVPRSNPAELRVPVQPGTHTVIVDGVDVGRTADFELDVRLSPIGAAPRNDTCANPREIRLDANGADGFTVNLEAANDDVESCFGTGGPDAVYTLVLEEAAWVTVQVAGQPNDFAVGAYLQAACGDGRYIACGFGFDQMLEAGEYQLVIDGADANSRGRVDVQVSTETFGDTPANDSCADAQVLDAAGGELVADTRGANDDEQEGCEDFNGEGGDLVYRLPAAGGEDYFVQAVPHGGWDLSLAITVGDCDGRRACSDGALTEALTFGADADRLIFVDGSNGEGGPFTLRWGAVECSADGDCGEGRCVNFRCE